jgi:hypothetical protein
VLERQQLDNPAINTEDLQSFHRKTSWNSIRHVREGEVAYSVIAFSQTASRSIYLAEHDLFRKPVPTFWDHALTAQIGARLWRSMMQLSLVPDRPDRHWRGDWWPQTGTLRSSNASSSGAHA